MKILLVGSFLHPIYAPAFSNGFRELGHEVIEIDYERYHISRKNTVSCFLNRFQDRYLYGPKMRQFNDDIVNAVETAKPEMVFLYRCHHVWPSTLDKIKDWTILFSYNNDDPFSGVPSKSFVRYHIACNRICHLNYVYRKKNIDDYARIGVTNTRVLLPYYLRLQNYPIESDRKIPIAFLGHFEDDERDRYILKMKEAGLPVVVFGNNDWKKAPLYPSIQDVIQPEKRGMEYNMSINCTQICLVFFSKINHDTYTRRCFEIPATKTLMLSEYSEDMDRMFPADECAVYFKTVEELIEKSKYLLAHPEEIRRIALNGYERLKSIGGSEVDRCKEIIQSYFDLKYQVS